MIAAPPTATLYWRPTAFIDAPFGFDGQFERLAGSARYFSAWEVVAREGGARTGQWLVPVDRVAAALEGLSSAQAEAAQSAIKHATTAHAPIRVGERQVRLDTPQIVGILNMTPDSFSDGGKHGGNPELAAEAGFALSMAGAAIVDIGGESTRPGAQPVWEGDEIERIVPVIERLARGGTLVSVDTRKAVVMEAALAAGAAIVNDISALRYDDRSADIVARAGCPVVLMHAPSASSDPHKDGKAYGDVLFDVYDWMAVRIYAAVAAGVARDKIIVDPGIGFGKGVADNLTLLGGLALFHTLGCPILFGASRKRMIGALDDEAAVDARLAGSIALHGEAAQRGAQLLRVHDVRDTRQALRMLRGLSDVALTPPAAMR